MVRPLVLRARAGETVEICFENHVRGRQVGIHLIADHYDVLTSDGAHVGANPSSLAGPPAGSADELDELPNAPAAQMELGMQLLQMSQPPAPPAFVPTAPVTPAYDTDNYMTNEWFCARGTSFCKD